MNIVGEITIKKTAVDIKNISENTRYSKKYATAKVKFPVPSKNIRKLCSTVV